MIVSVGSLYIHVNAYIYIYTYTYIYTHTYTQIHTYIHICMYTCMCLCMYLCTYIYIYICMYIICMYIFIHLDIRSFGIYASDCKQLFGKICLVQVGVLFESPGEGPCGPLKESVGEPKAESPGWDC